VTSSCETPLALDSILAYGRGELSSSEAEALEEHYFGCAACTARLEMVRRLEEEIATLFRQGRVSSSVTGELVRHASGVGLRLRVYELGPGERVACTAAPADDFVVLRLAVPGLADEEAVDLEAESVDLTSGERSSQLMTDIAVDRSAGEIVYAHSAALVRTFPRSRWTMTARLRGPRGERKLVPYELDHTPWQELPADQRA
jgi:hypothetical protein